MKKSRSIESIIYYYRRAIDDLIDDYPPLILGHLGSFHCRGIFVQSRRNRHRWKLIQGFLFQ
jgi:hypothetical protein